MHVSNAASWVTEWLRSDLPNLPRRWSEARVGNVAFQEGAGSCGDITVSQRLV